MHGQATAPQSLPLIRAHSPIMTYFHFNKDVTGIYSIIYVSEIDGKEITAGEENKQCYWIEN